MTFKQKILRKRESGFTIVELLIVIVVIGILATLTIVSYSGITASANTTKAQVNAKNAADIANAYAADNGSYPATAAAINGYAGAAKLPATITVLAGQADADADTPDFDSTAVLTSALSLAGKVAYSCLDNCTAPVLGGRVYYWNFTSNGPDANGVIYVGDATAADIFAQPAS